MSKARILVVDDEPAVLKVLVTRLQLAGYQVYSATNGEEALESFHRDSTDLIVLDVMITKKDGYDVFIIIIDESVFKIIL
jgi:DNA-binding response OmpR family regulator